MLTVILASVVERDKKPVLHFGKALYWLTKMWRANIKCRHNKTRHRGWKTKPGHVTDLWGPSDHVLDEVPVARGVYDGHIVLAGLKLPQWDVNGNASLPLCLQLEPPYYFRKVVWSLSLDYSILCSTSYAPHVPSSFKCVLSPGMEYGNVF